MHLKKIGVFVSNGCVLPNRLLDAISSLFDLQFVRIDEVGHSRCDAAILFGVSQKQATEASMSGVRCLAFIGDQPKPVASPKADVVLGDVPCLAHPFRGRTLPDTSIGESVCLTKEPADKVVARKGENSLWIRQTGGPSAVDLVAFNPPEITGTDYLFQFFQRDNWARLLPILHFAQEVSEWELPPPRATLMFDDPNLHWKSYGYINYERIIQHASRYNYHASFATVPMDSWYVHGRTAHLFRENPSRVSLLIHGNDHTYFELTKVSTRKKQEALAAQALRRIQRLERLVGLDVPRVMAPPHGACCYGMANILLRTGFEAACISRSSLMKRNPNSVWPITIGMNPAEFFGGGLPIIPRYNIRWDETYPLFAAFLGQPIIPVGHHDDASSGLDFLRQSADLINSVDRVRWMDMKSIARTNFCTRRDGETLHIKMYSRKIRLRVPDGFKHLCVHRPWLDGNTEEKLQLIKAGPVVEIIKSCQREHISVREGEDIEVASIFPNMIDHQKVRIFRSPPWAIARRQLCEGRDRLRPAMDGLFGLSKPKKNERLALIPNHENNTRAAK